MLPAGLKASLNLEIESPKALPILVEFVHPSNQLPTFSAMLAPCIFLNMSAAPIVAAPNKAPCALPPLKAKPVTAPLANCPHIP